MERMPGDMLLKTIRELSEIGALDMVVLMPGETPISIQQASGLPRGGSQPSLGDRQASLSVKEKGQLLESLEHIAHHFKEKAQRQNQPKTVPD
jgi:hypothetical protein